MYADEGRNKNILRHAGFRVGLIGGVVLVAVYLLFDFLFQGAILNYLLVWPISLFVYFVAARTAAQQHYDSQKHELHTLQGVQGAGMGAALITCLITWIFIVLRWFYLDATGYLILLEPITLCASIFFNFLIAIAIGNWGGKTVENKYRISIDDY